jgi:large subunit ribosomal protein L7/L12
MADDKKTQNEEKKEEVKQEETPKKETASLDPKLQKIIDEVAQLSVLELSELVKALEEKFDVQAVAAAPVAAAGAGGNGGQEAAAEEKSAFTVVLADAGANKISVIKALREIKPDLGLKEAKDMTDQTPAEVLVDAKKEEAEEAKKKLEEAGAKVELK